MHQALPAAGPHPVKPTWTPQSCEGICAQRTPADVFRCLRHDLCAIFSSKRSSEQNPPHIEGSREHSGRQHCRSHGQVSSSLVPAQLSHMRQGTRCPLAQQQGLLEAYFGYFTENVRNLHFLVSHTQTQRDRVRTGYVVMQYK